MKFARIQGEKSLHNLEKKLPNLYKWVVKDFKEANDYMTCLVEEGLYNEVSINLSLTGLNKKNNYIYEINVVIEDNKAIEFIVYINKEDNRWKAYDTNYNELNWKKCMQYINELEKVGLTKVEETIIKEISFII